MEASLEQVKSSNEVFNVYRNKTVRIFSYEHEMYWRPGCAGYTPDGLKAGVWSFLDAYEATKHCGPEKRIAYRVA